MAPHARLLIACLALASCGDAGRDPDAPQRTTPAATDGTSGRNKVCTRQVTFDR